MGNFSRSKELIGIGVLTVLAALAPPAMPQDSTNMNQDADAIVYQPPFRGAPSAGSRVGGGTRGIEKDGYGLRVLAPDHVGLTIHAQPALYWFTAKAIEEPVELTLLEEGVDESVLDLVLKPPTAAGFHALRLDAHGVRLKQDVPYQWYVAIVMDPNSRSRDIVATGEIRRVPPSDEHQSQLRSANETTKPRVYAVNGYWYDALDGLAALIAKAPSNARLRSQRAALLAQVGLDQAAAFERGMNK